jgi:hypothetical protein
MRRITYLPVALVFIAACANAQQPLSDEEIRSSFSGKKVEWGTDGVSNYKADGGYEYFQKSTGQRYEGKFNIGANRLCYDFANGGSQCDRIMKDKDGIYMINSGGIIYRAKFP